MAIQDVGHVDGTMFACDAHAFEGLGHPVANGRAGIGRLARVRCLNVGMLRLRKARNCVSRGPCDLVCCWFCRQDAHLHL